MKNSKGKLTTTTTYWFALRGENGVGGFTPGISLSK